MPFNTAGVFTPLFRFGSSTKADTQFQPQVDADIQDIAAGLTLLETQVGSTGSGSAPGGTAGNVQYNNSGIFGGYTDTQLTSHVNLFTATTSGSAPLSGGGTANFLRADGTWAAPAVGTALSTPPGGSNLQIQYNNASAFGGLTDTQVTARINVFTSTLKGSTPQSGGGTLNFLRADGNWTIPSGGTAGGSNKSIQFNNSGVLDGNSGLTYSSSVLTLGTGTADYEDGEVPILGNILDGSVGTPQTSVQPTFGMSRREQNTSADTTGGQSAVLFIENIANNTAAIGRNTQVNGLTVKVQQTGSGDALGIWGQAKSSAVGYSAFSAFFNANADANGAGALAIETNTVNAAGVDSTNNAVFGGTPGVMTALDLVASGANKSSFAVLIRKDNNFAGASWDSGVQFQGGAVTTTLIDIRTACANILAVNGSFTYTNGIDLSVGTYTGAAIKVGSGNVVCQNAALSTSAVDGFLYFPTCAGTPIGTPTSFTGTVPMVYDSANNFVYIYNAGWKKAGPLT